MAELHVDSGWVPPDTNVEDFGLPSAPSVNLFLKSRSRKSFGHVLLNLFNKARRLTCGSPAATGVARKHYCMLKGLGGNFILNDLWKRRSRFLEVWIGIRWVFRLSRGLLKRKSAVLGRKMPEIPELVYDSLRGANIYNTVLIDCARVTGKPCAPKSVSLFIGNWRNAVAERVILTRQRWEWGLMHSWLR